MIKAVLFDLDGVVRHFDPEHVADIERRHHIQAGAIAAFAFADPLIDHVTSGRLDRNEWITAIGGHVGNYDAAAEWGNQPSRVDPEVLSVVDEIHDLGFATAILTNGTDTIPEEVVALGLPAHFDAIFNSASIGYTKPDTRAFEHVLETLVLAGSEVFFVDDSLAKLVGADAVGMISHHFIGVDSLRRALLANGVPVAAR